MGYTSFLFLIMKVSIYRPQQKSSGIFSKLLVIFIIVPLVEIYFLIKIGQYVGALNTIIFIVVVGFLGAILMKLEGLRVWRQFRQDLAESRVPRDGLIDGLLILIGGFSLVIPGILTDFLGLLLIIPWTRHLIRNYLKKKFAKKFFSRDNIIDI